jgi:quinoprotein glucose dehydrogenase
MVALLSSVSVARDAAPADWPEYQTIPAAKPDELTPANGWPALESYRSWTRSLGGPTSNRYSALDQINRRNVGQLRVAWTYRSGDGPGNVQCNPIVVGDVLFAPTAGKKIVALNATTGAELWRFIPESKTNALQDIPARRGLTYWPGNARAPARILFACGTWIYALDPVTGALIKSFGDDGRAVIPTAGTVGGIVWKDIFIIPGYFGDVFGYDVATGRERWRFHTLAQPGEFGGDTWEGREVGANCWGGMALDESRGIAYVSTGSPKPNFVGTAHRGENLFSNCVIALNAATGERLWHFQEVRHDIWDFDLPAPPNLVTVLREGRRVDAVAQVTKIGNTLLLDRVTGKPLFPFRLRRAPESVLPGEKTARYQPDVQWPEPFIQHVFTFKPEDITTRTPAAREYISGLVAQARIGQWFAPPEPAKPAIYYGDNGGANWPGASYDPTTGYLYITANELPWIISIARSDDAPPLKPATAGEKQYQQWCAACHGATRGGVGVAPPLRGLRHHLNDEQIIALMKTGRGAMPASPPMTDLQQKQLLDFLLVRDRPQPPPAPGVPPQYSHSASKRLLDAEGYPGIKPPWGTLNCLDLNTGKIVWKVPLGEYPELTKAGVAKTGTENYGGSMTTAGGLVFAAGTRDAKLRAFDSATGAELWAGDLPHDGSTPPATYEVGGRQFVVVAAPGVRMLGGPVGDAWVAFALDP